MSLIDRPADELTPEELEQALAELPKPIICTKCGTELRRAKRYRGVSFGKYEHIEQVRGHKAVPDHE
jgi:hypothetical protein